MNSVTIRRWFKCYRYSSSKEIFKIELWESSEPQFILLNSNSQILVGDMGFPCSSVGKESASNAGDLGSIPGLGRSPGGGNGNPLQYSCLENPMDRRTWQATVHGVARVRHQLATKPPPPQP